MKTIINIDVEKELLDKAEQYARECQLSLSQLIELFFKNLNGKSAVKNVIQLVKEMEKSTLSKNADLKKLFMKSKKLNMVSKIFLDANVLLDFTLQRTNFEHAENLIQKGIDGIIELFITPSIVHITGYWLSKAYGSAKAKEILIALTTDVRVIDCDHASTLIALHSSIDDIEDALQYFAALKHGLHYFVSSDKKLKKMALPQLPVYEPRELLKIME